MRVEGDGYEQLNNAIQAGSFTYSPRTSKADIVEYYKETYGEKSWRQHAQHDFGLHTTTKYNSYRRQFDPSRLTERPKAGSANAESFKALGKTLPFKKTPKDTSGKRARVTFTGEFMTYDDKRPRYRTYTGTLSASGVREMRRGSFDPIFASFGFTPGIITYVDVTDISVDFL